MIRSLACVAVAALLVCGMTETKASDLGSEIDLTTFSEIAAEPSAVGDDIPLHEVAQRLGSAPRRFYLSGMIGPSFANFLTPDFPAAINGNDTLFTAGGALGVAFERRNGQLRLEIEGMGRDTYQAPVPNFTPGVTTILTNNWSVMQNAWRDVMLTERFGIYGGGGLGAGGYIWGTDLPGSRTYTTPAANFAWQFGGGLLWNLSDRLTFDVGYRYFQINTIQQAAIVIPNRFEASELMFTMRLYEPFRNWRR